MITYNKNNIYRSLLKGLLLFMLVAVILPLIILSFYNHPNIDDFVIANIVHKSGIFGTQKFLYFNQTGRYFSDFILCLNPLTFDAYSAYKFNSIVLLLLYLTATYWLCGKLFKNLTITGKLTLTSVFVLAFISHMPGIAEGVFWLSGSYNTFIPDILTLFLLGCMLGYYSSPNKKLYFTLSALLIGAIIGCYEINMVFIDLFILMFFLLTLVKRNKLQFPLTLLIACIFFSIVSITAPGNSTRGLTYPNAHNIVYTLTQTFLNGKATLIKWLPFMLLIGVLLFELLFQGDTINKDIYSVFNFQPRIILLLALVIPFVGLFICFWSEGRFPLPRMEDGVYFYFTLAMIYFSLSCIYQIKKNHPDFKLHMDLKVIFILVLIYASFFQTNNITLAYKDITSGTASAYNKERIERDSLLRNSKSDSCTIKALKNVPATLLFCEIPNDTSQWVNESFRTYYHKKYLKVVWH